MTDPLKEAEEEGHAAAVRIIEDLVSTKDLDQCVAEIRLAASEDNKFNFFLLRGIASLAALGLESSTQQST